MSQGVEGLVIDLGRALGFDDPLEVWARVRELYEVLDRDVEAGARGAELPCRKGCDACCHESVFLSAPEFLVVGAHLLTHWSPEARARLVDQMSALAERFEDELELLELLEPGAERDEVAARIKFRCPLLDEAGACTIYPARELNGRTFGASWLSGDEAYGCELTRAHLRVLNDRPPLVDARAARKRLVDAVPQTEMVHVYPYWFVRFGRWL